MNLREIAEALTAQVVGDDTLSVDRIVHPLDARGPGDLAVAIADEARAALDGCRAATVIVAADKGVPDRPFGGVIVADGGRGTLAALGALFDRGPPHSAGVHPTALIAADATVALGASVGPYAVVGPRSRIGAGAVCGQAQVVAQVYLQGLVGAVPLEQDPIPASCPGNRVSQSLERRSLGAVRSIHAARGHVPVLGMSRCVCQDQGECC